MALELFKTQLGRISTQVKIQIDGELPPRAPPKVQSPRGGLLTCTIEAGGIMNARIHSFPRNLADALSPSPPKRAVFLAYALQRSRAVGPKGTCAIVFALDST